MTAVTVPPTALDQLRHAQEVAAALADTCERIGRVVNSVSIDASRHGDASANIQFGSIEAVDEFAAVLGLSADNPHDPCTEKRADGLSVLYTRHGTMDGARIAAYCRRP